MINLSTLHVPLSITFALYDEDKYLLDPSLLEEKCSSGILIVTANKFNEICYLHTYGSVQVDTGKVTELLIITKEKIKHLNKILKDFKESVAGGMANTSQDMDICEDENGDISREKLKIKKGENVQKKINIYQINNI
jgi:hypothetical protein